MLELILGKNRQSNTEAVLERIAAGVRAKTPGQILIVPEQFSHAAERALCRRCGDSVSLYAEVLSFTRLADRVFSQYGGVSRETLDDGGRFTALALSLEQALPQLKVYAAARSKPELIVRLSQQIEEFKNYGVSAAALRAASLRFSGAFAQKLQELSLILESYDAVCAAGKADPSQKLERLRDLLWETDFGTGKSFYIHGFTDFTGLQGEIVRTLLRRGFPVTVTLVCDDCREGGAIFEAARETAARLLRAARESDSEWSVHTLEERGSGAFLREHLFSWDPAQSEETDRVALCRAENPEEECRAAAKEIRDLLMAGYRCREIAVACTDLACYAKLLQPLLAQCGIPSDRSGRESILQEPAIRAVLAAAEAAAGNLEQEAVFAFLKSPLGPLERDACDRLQNYAFIWRISGSRWQREFTMHPDGFGQTMDEAANARLRDLNLWRRQAAEPLLRLRAAWRDAVNTEGQVRAFYAFLREIRAEERLNTLSEQEGNASRRGQELRQLYEITLNALEQLSLVLGATVRSPEDFSMLLRQLLSQYSLGTIPAALDCVAIGDLPALRDQPHRALLVLGADEGALPQFAQDSGILTDQERNLLQKEAELHLSPDKVGRMDRELAVNYDVLCADTEKLYLSYAVSEPSYLFRRLSLLYPCAVCREASQQLLFTDAEDAGGCLAACAPEDPMEAILRTLPAAEETASALRERAAYTLGALSRAEVERLYQTVIQLSASKIDLFSACRCAYFLQYGLRAKERKEAAVDAPIFGTFVHDVLEHTAREVQTLGGFSAVDQEQLEAIARQRIEEFTKEQLGGLEDKEVRFQYLYARNQQELLQVVDSLGDELRKSRFVPSAFELGFLPGGELPPVEVAGETGCARVVGFVDRVDRYAAEEADYIRVVDYKTGKKEFRYGDVLNGMGMQMLIYLFALEGTKLWGRDVRPAGVLYFPARVPILSAPERPSEEEAEKLRKKEARRSGLLVNDERLLHAMEEFETQPEYLPCAADKEGRLQGDLADGAQMALLRSHVEKTLKSITDEIFSGNVRPNPYFRGADQSACRFCPFGAVCHLDSCPSEKRVFSAKKAAEFWKLLEQEERHGGD